MITPANVIKKFLAVLFVSYLAVGAGFLLRNLGKVPHYPDTRVQSTNEVLAPGYVKMAEEGRLDSRRGLFYALVLRLAHDLGGGPWDQGLELEHGAKFPPNAIPCWAPTWQTRAQILQLLSFLLVLIYAYRVLGPRALQGWRYSACLIAAIFLDPILVHAQLALMPDGLAMSACLLFVTGFVEYIRDQRFRGLTLLTIGALLAICMRPEKGVVLFVASAAASIFLALYARRITISGLVNRAWLAVAIVLCFWLGSAFFSATIQSSSGVWSMSEMVTHTRLMYPHLEELQPKLSEPIREFVTVDVARRYDQTPSTARLVIWRLSNGDANVRAQLTEEFRDVALSEKGGAILLDSLLDTLQNLIPVPAFLARWHVWMLSGAHVPLIKERIWESLVLWGMLSYHEPLWSRIALWMETLWIASLASLIPYPLFAKGFAFDCDCFQYFSLLSFNLNDLKPNFFL